MNNHKWTVPHLALYCLAGVGCATATNADEATHQQSVSEVLEQGEAYKTLTPAEVAELNSLAEGAKKRGAHPPVIFEYAHGVSENGDVEALKQMISLAKPSDVVTVPVGVYRDTCTLELKVSGTAKKPIILKAAEPGRVVFTGESAITVTGDYWVLQGLLFDGAAYRGSKFSSILIVSGAEGVRLTESAFLSCGSPDVRYVPVVTWQDGARGGRVDHCTFVDSLSMTL